MNLDLIVPFALMRDTLFIGLLYAKTHIASLDSAHWVRLLLFLIQDLCSLVFIIHAW